MRSRRVALRLLGVAGLVAFGVGSAPARAATEALPAACVTRTLVLSAYPSEADAVLSHMTLDPEPVRVVQDHHFYVGSISGKPVVSTMTGIGLTNATNTTEKALSGLTCASAGMSIGAVLFSGVAGGADRTQIGDVAVPAQWTRDDGGTWHGVDPSMLAAATDLHAPLSRVNTAGDPACACVDPHLVPLIDIGREPKIVVGGTGYSSDALNGQASPCIPNAGDVFGCQPCHAPDRGLPDVVGTGPGALAWLLLNIQGGYPAGSTKVYDAVDQETAAALAVADAHHVPFLGFRGMSDGPGDPLNLPGFPFQFFFYRQLAADNAAIAVTAYLQTWTGPPASTGTTAASVLGSRTTAEPRSIASRGAVARPTPLHRHAFPTPAAAPAVTPAPPTPVQPAAAVLPARRGAASDEGIPGALALLAVLLMIAATSATVVSARR
ncbi:MAG: hypothetical protein QOE35_1682 [Actinomycetota bacterium]|jgi:nucleoside phosphorylase